MARDDNYYPQDNRGKKFSKSLTKEWWAYTRKRWIICLLRFQSPFRSTKQAILTILAFIEIFNGCNVIPAFQKGGIVLGYRQTLVFIETYALICGVYYLIRYLTFRRADTDYFEDFKAGSEDFRPWMWDWDAFTWTGYKAKYQFWWLVFILMRIFFPWVSLF